MENNGKKISLLKTIVKNSSALLGVKMFMPLSYLIITISIARLLGTRDFGVFSIVVGYYGIFRLISIFGIDVFLMREIPQHREKANFYLSNAYFLGMVFSLVSIFLMNGLLYATGYSSDLRLVGFILSLSLLPAALISYIESAFIAFHKSQYVFFMVLLREIFKFIIVMIAIIIYKNLILAVTALSASCFLGFLINIVAVNFCLFKPRFKIQMDMLRRMFKVSFTMALIAGTSSFFIVIDIIVLSKIKGEAAVGLYSAAGKFTTLAFLFIDSIGMALSPIMSRFYHNSARDFREFAETTLRYFLIFIFLFVVTIFFFSDKLILLIFGEKYINSAVILKILIWSVIFNGGGYFLAKILFTADRQKYDLYALLIASTVNLLLNIPFTMRWGYLGTAIATLLSMVILFIILYYFFCRKLFYLNIQKIWIRPLIAGVLFFVSLIYLAKINLYAGFMLSLIIYLLLIVTLKVIKKEEIMIFTKALFGR